jgi:superfamily II DNA/RNA helicase
MLKNSDPTLPSETATTAEAPAQTLFVDLLSDPRLLNNLTGVMGFTTSTPIQAAAMPIVLTGKSLYAGAKTGSGKTVAFLAPIAERLMKGEADKALVLAPTRELVLQIDEEAARLLDGQTDVVSVPLYGGVPVDPQILAIKAHKPRIFIATPGRALDLFQEGFLPLSSIQIGVLDEADRMCDMGFAPQVSQILDSMNQLKQVLLFSATLPKELNEIMSKYCPNPERIQIDAPDQSSETIEHFVLNVSRRDKVRRLVQFLKANPDSVSVIFTKTRNRADEIYEKLSREIEKTAVLHAGLPMPERERTTRALKDGRTRHLIATDVFARGIDVDGITHVIHYDLPFGLDEYIHRSGRSGRAGRAGMTIAFVEGDQPEQVALYQSFAKKVKFQPLDGSSLPGEQPTRQNAPDQRGEQRGRRPHRQDNQDRQERGDRQERPDRQRTRRGGASRRGPAAAGNPSRSQSSPRAAQRSTPTAAPKKSAPVTIVGKAKSLFKKLFS